MLKSPLHISSRNLHFTHTGSLLSCLQEHSRKPLQYIALQVTTLSHCPIQSLCVHEISINSQLKTYKVCFCYFWQIICTPLGHRHLLPSTFATFEISLWFYRMTMSIIVQVKTLSYCRTRPQDAHEAQFIQNIKKSSQLKPYHKVCFC